MEPTPDPILVDLEREIATRAALIGAPASLLPTYFLTGHDTGPSIEREYHFYVYDLRDRGLESDRKRTPLLDEVLYWIFYDVTFSMASNWELEHRVEGEDSRRGLFTKQIELLQQLDPTWVARYRRENARWLADAGVARLPG